MNWNVIETVPLDGTIVLFATKQINGWRIVSGHASSKGKTIYYNGTRKKLNIPFTPTHWAVLPDMPEED